MKIRIDLNITICILLLTSVIYSGCQKTADGLKPVIEIWKPADNTSFSVGDSIFIEGVASGETTLEYIQITLTNKNLIVQDHFINIPVNQNPQSFAVWYDITNNDLVEGGYFIQIRASDGTNTKYQYKPIWITPLPISLKELIILCRNGNQSFTALTAVIGESTPSQILQYHHQYSSSSVSSSTNQLFVTGKGFGECYVFSLPDYTLDFKLHQDGTPAFDYHQNIFTWDKRFYLGLTEGYIKGYNHIGMQLFTATLKSDRQPGVMSVHNQQYLIVAEEEFPGTRSWISSYFLTSGNKWADYQLPDNFKVVAIKPFNNNEIIIAGNVAGKGRLIVWNINANSIHTPLQFSTGEINDIAKLNNNEYIVASDSELLIYQHSTESTSQYIQIAGIRKVIIDTNEKRLFAGMANNIKAYDLNTKAMIWDLPLPSQLADFHLHYSRF